MTTKLYSKVGFRHAQNNNVAEMSVMPRFAANLQLTTHIWTEIEFSTNMFTV